MLSKGGLLSPPLPMLYKLNLLHVNEMKELPAKDELEACEEQFKDYNMLSRSYKPIKLRPLKEIAVKTA